MGLLFRFLNGSKKERDMFVFVNWSYFWLLCFIRSTNASDMLIVPSLVWLV